MLQRAGFMGQVRLAVPFRRPPAVSRRLGGMLDDYNAEINALKDKLSRLQKPYMQPAPPPSAYPFSSELPPPSPPKPYTPPPQPPPGELNCYTRPDGSAYYGYPDGISTPNNLTEFQCAGIANPRPLEPPPGPTITSDVDFPGPFVPIAVREEQEEPPPVNTSQAKPGEPPPTATGMTSGREGEEPTRYWPPPSQEELDWCPKGITKVAPGADCPYGTSKTIPGSNCCYPDVQSVPQYGSWYPPSTTPPPEPGSGYNFPSFPGLPFSGEGGVSATALSGRRIPIVNLGRSRRWPL